MQRKNQQTTQEETNNPNTTKKEIYNPRRSALNSANQYGLSKNQNARV